MAASVDGAKSFSLVIFYNFKKLILQFRYQANLASARRPPQKTKPALNI